MKKTLLFSTCLLCFLLSNALAIDFMGPPNTQLKKGQTSVGLIYSLTERDFNINGNGVSKTLHNVRSDRYYANLIFGLEDWWELGFRYGAADTDCHDKKFTGGVEFAWGVGTKFTLTEDEDVKWGGLFQMNWFQTDERYNTNLTEYGLSTGKYYVETEGYEMLFAAGPTFQKRGWKLYGGPFAYLVDGDFDATLSGTTTHFKLQQEEIFGGYIGAIFTLIENTTFTIECAANGDGTSVGALLGWKF